MKKEPIPTPADKVIDGKIKFKDLPPAQQLKILDAAEELFKSIDLNAYSEFLIMYAFEKAEADQSAAPEPFSLKYNMAAFYEKVSLSVG